MDNLKAVEKEAFEKESNVKEKKGFNPGGLVLIAVGVAFLFAQYSSVSLHNWWAVFILIPVVGTWGSAMNSIQRNGGITREAIRSFMGGLFPLFVALIFLFNWDWGRVWPGFLILAGLNALASGWGRD